MMIGYDIYDCFTMEHFRLSQRMTLTIKIYCSRLYILVLRNFPADKIIYICLNKQRNIKIPMFLSTVMTQNFFIP
jgi:hypothetical protein